MTALFVQHWRKDRYPHDLRSGKNAPDAVTVLRKALAAEVDGSIVIAQVGFSTNLSNMGFNQRAVRGVPGSRLF